MIRVVFIEYPAAFLHYLLHKESLPPSPPHMTIWLINIGVQDRSSCVNFRSLSGASHRDLLCHRSPSTDCSNNQFATLISRLFRVDCKRSSTNEGLCLESVECLIKCRCCKMFFYIDQWKHNK